MEFKEVINKRRTSRQWLKKDVDEAVIKRIIEAGMKAPTWDHKREWQFILLRTREEKERAFAMVKSRVKSFDVASYDHHPFNLSNRIYVDAMPKQYSMLTECPYVIVPLFRSDGLNSEWVSKLNPFATAWCMVENILLTTIDEGLGYSMRIPLNREHDIVLDRLGVPKGWMTPCFIGIGHPDESEFRLPQFEVHVEDHLHMGQWGGISLF